MQKSGATLRPHNRPTRSQPGHCSHLRHTPKPPTVTSAQHSPTTCTASTTCAKVVHYAHGITWRNSGKPRTCSPCRCRHQRQCIGAARGERPRPAPHSTQGPLDGRTTSTLSRRQPRSCVPLMGAGVRGGAVQLAGPDVARTAATAMPAAMPMSPARRLESRLRLFPTPVAG